MTSTDTTGVRRDPACRETDRLRGILAAPPPDGATALVTHLRGPAAVRRVAAPDPLLPAGPRPAGWPGQAMREAWGEVSDRLREPARAHVAVVLPQRCTEDMSA